MIPYFKDFDAWNSTKKKLDAEDNAVNIRAGEIRWVSFGVNVGSEIDGKGESFTRPALVIHVIGSHLALIVPMSTKVKNMVGYLPFDWKERTTALCLHQIRVISQKRILARKGKISNERLNRTKKEISQFFSLL